MRKLSTETLRDRSESQSWWGAEESECRQFGSRVWAYNHRRGGIGLNQAWEPTSVQKSIPVLFVLEITLPPKTVIKAGQKATKQLFIGIGIYQHRIWGAYDARKKGSTLRPSPFLQPFL